MRGVQHLHGTATQLMSSETRDFRRVRKIVTSDYQLRRAHACVYFGPSFLLSAWNNSAP